MTSWVLTELIVFSVLCILWLADAADATAGYNLSFLEQFGYAKTCGGLDDFITEVEAVAIENPEQYGFLLDYDLGSFETLCRSHEAVQALAFVSWIILMGYAVTLLISALVASSRGHPAIWTSTVRNTRFLEHHKDRARETEVEVPLSATQHDSKFYASSRNLKVEA